MAKEVEGKVKVLVCCLWKRSGEKNEYRNAK